MEKLSMFGKSFNTIGSTDSNFVIKTKGDIKIQWGNKFIDLIKKGKIASSGSNILKVVDSVDNISTDGIYLISGEDEVWLSLDGTKVNLAGENTYVSFLTELKDVTADLKHLALTNAGFYYATLEDAQNAGISAGIIFVEEEGKLYIVKDGLLLDYYISLSNTDIEKEEENPNNKFKEIYVGDLHIFTDNDYSVIDAPKFKLTLNGTEYMSVGDSMINIGTSLTMGANTIFLSEGATSNKGYRLYNTEEGSVLEIDDIIWRNMPDFSSKNSKELLESIIHSLHTNIIKKVEQAGDKVKCILKYKNNYEVGLSVYIFLSEENTLYLISLNVIKEDELDYIIAKLQNEKIAPELISIKVTYDSNSKTATVDIPKGETSGQTAVTITGNDINKAEVLAGPKNIEFEDNFGEVLDRATKEIILNKATPKEYKIVERTDEHILVTVDPNEIDSFMELSVNTIVCLSSKPFIKIKDNNLTVLDRSVIKDGKPDETVHSLVGVIKDIDFKFDFNFPELLDTILNDCPEGELTWDAPEKKPDEIQVGIYSDNLKSIKAKLSECLILKGKILEGEIVNSIAVNGKYYTPIVYSPQIYNAVFKEGCEYPLIEPTLDYDDRSKNIVYSEWVKYWDEYWVEELKKLIAALEAKVDKNKSDLDNKNDQLDLDNSDLNDKITNILLDITDIETAIANIELNYVKKSEFEELVKQYITPKYGDVNNPVVLISGTIYRATKSSTTFSFKGSKKDKITSVTPLVKEGLMTVTILNEGTLNITSVSVVQNSTELTKNASTTGIRDRGCGGHWFEARADGKKIYIREIHQGDGNNDTWVTDTWTHDNAPLAINITVFGYITT